MNDSYPEYTIFLEDVRQIAKQEALDAPRTVLSNICEDCFDRKSKVLGESLTGKDLTDTKDRDHVRGVYEYAEKRKKRSDIVGGTALIETVKILIVASLVYLGFKVGK